MGLTGDHVAGSGDHVGDHNAIDTALLNALYKTMSDAKGDLLVGTANDTIARLPVGTTTGHALLVDPTATAGMAWGSIAGGRIFSAERDFGFKGDNATDNLAAWNAMWTTVASGDLVQFGSGTFRHSGTLQFKKSGVTIRGAAMPPYWPYRQSSTHIFGTIFRPSSSSFVGSAQFYFPQASDNSAVEVHNCTLERVFVFGNSVRNTGGDIHGILMQGFTTGHRLSYVTIMDPSGHGIFTTVGSSVYPRGGEFDHVVVWSAGNRSTSGGTGAQWGMNLETFTDAKLTNLLVGGCVGDDIALGSVTGGGIRITGPGQITAENWHVPFNNGVGIYLSGTSGNGGFMGTNIVTDRNAKEGLLSDAKQSSSGRQEIVFNASHFRRDGGNKEATGGTYAGINVGASSGSVAPHEFNACRVSVYEDDDAAGDGPWYPFTAFNVGSNITYIDLNGGSYWGQTNAITGQTGKGTDTAGNLRVRASSTTRFFTGVPGSRTPVNPTFS